MVQFSREELRKIGGTFAAGTSLDKRDRALFALGVCSRWRISEILSLRRRDLLDQDGHVRRHIAVAAKRTKTRVASSLDLDDHVAGILGVWLAECERWGCWRRDDPAFPKVGARLEFDRVAAWRMVRRRCRMAGIPQDRHGTHSFKKTAVGMVFEHWAKELGEENAWLRTQQWSGHRELRQLQAYLKELPRGDYKKSEAVAARNAEGL